MPPVPEVDEERIVQVLGRPPSLGQSGQPRELFLVGLGGDVSEPLAHRLVDGLRPLDQVGRRVEGLEGQRHEPPKIPVHPGVVELGCDQGGSHLRTRRRPHGAIQFLGRLAHDVVLTLDFPVRIGTLRHRLTFHQPPEIGPRRFNIPPGIEVSEVLTVGSGDVLPRRRRTTELSTRGVEAALEFLPRDFHATSSLQPLGDGLALKVGREPEALGHPTGQRSRHPIGIDEVGDADGVPSAHGHEPPVDEGPDRLFRRMGSDRVRSLLDRQSGRILPTCDQQELGCLDGDRTLDRLVRPESTHEVHGLAPLRLSVTGPPARKPWTDHRFRL